MTKQERYLWSGDEAVAASPDEAPAEDREMVSDYFKAIGEMK